MFYFSQGTWILLLILHWPFYLAVEIAFTHKVEDSLYVEVLVS